MKFKYIVIFEDYALRGTNSKEEADNAAMSGTMVIDCEAGTATGESIETGSVEVAEIEALNINVFDYVEPEVELEDEDDGERTDLTGDDL